MGSGPRLYTEGHVAAEKERKMDIENGEREREREREKDG
jgi:hypothetical protein